MFRSPPTLTDNNPDDFDSPRYVAYRPAAGAQWRVLLWSQIRRLGMPLILAAAIGGGFLCALLLLPSQAPQVIIVTAPATATPPGDIAGDFPLGVVQRAISLPARIDQTLEPGEKHGYRFLVAPGLQWRVQVFGDNTLDPLITLYNPDGTVKALNDNNPEGGLSSEILFNADSSNQYGLLVEGVAGSGGGYTLLILPQEN